MQMLQIDLLSYRALLILTIILRIVNEAHVNTLEFLEDCSPKPAILCILRSRIIFLKINKRAIVFYQRRDNSERTNQIREFLMAHAA